MTSRHLLAIVALGQAVLFTALIILITLNRWFRLRRSAEQRPHKVALDHAMARWATGQIPVGTVVSGLGQLPTPLIVDELVTWSTKVSEDRWRELTSALQHPWWAKIIRSNSSSARWWKRLETARFLSVVAMPADTARVLRLLRDHHPAVHIAAAATLERVDNTALATAALERLPTLAPTVSAYYAGMLVRSRPFVVQQLLKLLGRTNDPALPRFAEFAARLKEPALRGPLTALGSHPDGEVRTQVARALGGYRHPESFPALATLAADSAWPVRAQAVRSLGILADPSSLPIVRVALRDAEWWVRLRAALALTRFGSAGRNALLEADIGPSANARQMAHLILGFSADALTEFAA
ncbi:MAG TPA: HEAT repeat domain-containing protein [Gemmatimonadales bacterium]|nr:HEAT repeat domain-containing protein [Gemmatimonadales bacterium]